MKKNLNQHIEQVRDEPTRNALRIIAEELDRIRAVRPVAENLTQVTNAINTITGKLR